jgi:translation initiation factor 2A
VDSIHIFDGSDVAKGPVAQLAVDNVQKFVLSPGSAPYRIACFCKGRGGGSSSARIYKYPELEKPVASKSFMRADKAELEWNRQATAVLVSTSTDTDKTGKSYYGETFLYYLQADGALDYNVPLDKEGPIMDVKWSPLGGQFVVIYGFTPCKQTLFDAKSGTPTFEFGVSPRNTVIWSPHGRFLCIAGFGNLAGDMDFWDRNKLKKMGTVQSSCAVSYEWSPDSRLFITATLTPRLRVDNNFRVYSYAGELLYRRDYPELCQIAIRPALPGAYPDRPSSPRVADRVKGGEIIAPVQAKPQAYRPPGAGGRAASDIFKRPDDLQGKKVESSGKYYLFFFLLFAFAWFFFFRRTQPQPYSISSSTLFHFIISIVIDDQLRYVPPSARGGGERTIPGMAPSQHPSSSRSGPSTPQHGSSGGRVIPGLAVAPASAEGGAKSKTALKKEKERAKQVAEEEKVKALAALKGTPEPGKAAPASPADTSAAAAPAPVDPTKRIKAINKKLQEIEDLKNKAAEGETLTKDEEAKIEAEAELEKDLGELEGQWK